MMHGLMNRSIQCFLRDTYGPGCWSAVARAAGLAPDGFEAMLDYDDALTDATLAAAVATLGRPRETILEDIGTYLVSHPNTEALRRLLRFGGVSFVDFLLSLEELPGRGRLAVPDLGLPTLDLAERGDGIFVLSVRGGYPGLGHVVVGMMRALADDYGALVSLDGPDLRDGGEEITIHLHDHRFAEGRRFHLSAEAG